MSLGSAWSVGLSGLATASDQMSLVSRNVSRAGDANATRKIGEQVTVENGSVRLAAVRRVSDVVLLEGLLNANAAYGAESVLSDALDRLDGSIMAPQLGASPAALIANLEASLRQFANDPSSTAGGSAAVNAARDLATSLNAATSLVTSVRTNADSAIANAVGEVNGLLVQLESLNKDIVSSPPDRDVTDQLDQRDAVLKSISERLAIRVVQRDGNDVVVYTDGGVVLFETAARDVSFQPSGLLGPGATGYHVRVDGVDVTGAGAIMPSRSGSIVGLVEVRDGLATGFQSQLDEIARGLIETFSDSDRSGGTKPDLPGLFTWPAGNVPPSGTLVSGLAGQIRLNPQIDPSQGGDVRFLRDGGASAPTDPDYNANPSGLAGFSARILHLVGELSEVRSFDPATGLKPSVNIKGFASESVGWLNELRQNSADRLELRTAVKDRANETLLGVAGINLDQQMSDLLRLEQSFQAASRLIATVDQMIKTLLEAVR